MIPEEKFDTIIEFAQKELGVSDVSEATGDTRGFLTILRLCKQASALGRMVHARECLSRQAHGWEQNRRSRIRARKRDSTVIDIDCIVRAVEIVEELESGSVQMCSDEDSQTARLLTWHVLAFYANCSVPKIAAKWDAKHSVVHIALSKTRRSLFENSLHESEKVKRILDIADLLEKEGF